MSGRVTGIVVHEKRQDGNPPPLRTAGGRPGDPSVRYTEEAFPARDGWTVMKDREIESDQHRVGLRPGEGDVCMVVRPGERLGQLYVCLQYEGEKGKVAECLAGQNALIEDVSARLHELLADAAGEWEIEIHVEPCPRRGPGEPYRFVEAARRIAGDRETRRGPDRDEQIERRRDV